METENNTSITIENVCSNQSTIYDDDIDTNDINVSLIDNIISSSTTLFYKHSSNMNEIYNIKIKCKLMEKLGCGAFGIVYKALILLCDDPNYTKKFPTNLCAIKKIRCIPKYDNEREIRFYNELDHENIVKCFYYYPTKSSTKCDLQFINLIMEYMPTNLFSYIKWTQNSNEIIPELTIMAIIFQILNALNYIHNLNICHRDIKPHNILFDNNNLHVKLCDFGSAKNLTSIYSNNINSTYIGARIYRAPELLFNSPNYSFPIDIWASGCVLGELMLLNPMFFGNDSIEIMRSILHLMGTPPIAYMNDICNEFDFSLFPLIEPTIDNLISNYKLFVRGLLKRLLIFSPKIRPSAKELLQCREFMDYFVNGAINNRQNDFASTFLQLTVISRDIHQQNVYHR